MRLIMLGAPGSGKGTLATLLSEHYGLPHISTGDIFRDNIRKGTELGTKVKTILDSGELVPDEVTMQILAHRLEEDDAQKGFILDGFPRTIEQAEMLDEQYPINKAILLNVTDEVLMERLTLRRVCAKCGMTFHLKNIPPKKEGVCDVCGTKLVERDDQKPEVVKHRLEVYQEETVPVIDHYRAQERVVDIDANGSPDQIFIAITSQISVE